MIVNLITEVCKAIIAVFVALRTWWPGRAGAGTTAYGMNGRACRTLSKVSIERFSEMRPSWAFVTVRCTRPWNIFILCQVDIDRPRGCWTFAGASFGTWMGSHVVRAGMMVPKKTRHCLIVMAACNALSELEPFDA